MSLERNSQSAKDLFQSTIERVYGKFESVRSRAAFLSYLFTTAWRLHKQDQVKNSRFVSIEDMAGFDARDPREADSAADVETLYAAMKLLPEEQRQCIMLFEIVGFSQKEVCEILNITPGALKMRLKRGKDKLREILREDEPKSELFPIRIGMEN